MNSFQMRFSSLSSAIVLDFQVTILIGSPSFKTFLLFLLVDGMQGGFLSVALCLALYKLSTAYLLSSTAVMWRCEHGCVHPPSSSRRGFPGKRTYSIWANGF